MSNSRAYLYDSTLQPVGHVGVLVKMSDSGYGSYPDDFDVAVFSPWPDALVEGTAFAVRTESDNDVTRWRSPHEVVHFRAVGQPERTNVAFVVLEGPSTAPDRVVGGGGLRHSLGIAAHGVRAELASFSATFTPLTNEVDARSDVESLPNRGAHDGSVRGQLATPGYTRTTGGPNVVNRSLCRILHWD
jgi:hypothetical protein